MLSSFDLLAAHAELPEKLIRTEEPSDYWLVVMAGTHGDEQYPIQYIRDRLGPGAFPPGVLAMVVNKEAAVDGVRFTGTEQGMAWYPGNMLGMTNEDRVAGSFTWLKDEIDPDHVVLDFHHNSSGNEYLCAGQRVTTAAMAAGHILGHRLVQYSTWARFPQTVPSSITVEEAVPTDSEERERYYKELDAKVGLIADLGWMGLHKYYHENNVAGDMTFLENEGEILLVHPRTGEVNEEVMEVLDLLEKKDVPNVMGAKVDLENEVLEALGLEEGVHYRLGSGPYQNRSRIIPNEVLGRTDGKVRRLVWSTVLAEREAPGEVPGEEGLLEFGRPVVEESLGEWV